MSLFPDAPDGPGLWLEQGCALGVRCWGAGVLGAGAAGRSGGGHTSGCHFAGISRVYIVQAAGWPIWPLLLVSIIAVALIIERLVVCAAARSPGDLLQRAVGSTSGEETMTSFVEMEKHSPLGRVAAGLRSVTSSREIMKESIEEAGAAVAHDLGCYLTTLGTIASISPLMGCSAPWSG